MGERVDIVVSETGAKVVEGNIAAIGAAADKTAVSVDKVKTSTTGLSATASAAATPLAATAAAANSAATGMGNLAPAAANANTNLQNVAKTAGGQTTQAVDTLSSSLGFLKLAFAGLAIEQVIQVFTNISDVFQGVVNRLKLVTTSAKDLAATEQELLDISNRTRASFSATANLYSKLALSASQLGIDTKELLPTLETVNQLIAIGGSTAQESASGLLQFSQALASNRFQGDEMRSVLEGLPALGLAIAKGLGVTTGALRTMGSEGKLTTKVILDALSKQAPEIAKQFAAIKPTIAGAFQVLQNNILQLVGTFDQLNSVGSTLGQGILFLANNLATFARIAGVAAVATIAFYSALALQSGYQAVLAGLTAVNARLQAYIITSAAAGIETTFLSRAMVAFQGPIGAVTRAIQFLWATMLANPLVLIITLIGAAAAALYFFGNSVKLNSDGSITALGAVVGILQTLWDYLKIVGGYVASVFTPIWSAFASIITTAFDLALTGLKKLLDFLGSFIPSLAGASASLGKFGETLEKNMKEASKSMADATLASKDFGKGFADTANTVGGAGQDIKKSLDTVNDGLSMSISQMRELALTTRNAMGEMVVATDEWARRSGAAFNSVSNASKGASSSIDHTASSFGGGSSGGSSSPTLTGSQSFGNVNSAGFQHTNSMLEGGVSTDNGQTFQQRGASLKNYLLYGLPTGYASGGPIAWNNLLEEAGNDASLQSRIRADAHNRGIQGFRYGGAFDVGGSGGTDSQLVQFMASPEERVTIETPAQRGRNAKQAQGRNVTVNMSVQTPDANSFRRSKHQTYLDLRSKLAGV